jgi:hypothetical protein
MGSWQMLTGYVDEVCRQYIVGWAFDSDRPIERVELVVLIGGEEHGRAIADRARPDLLELGTYGDGNHGFVYRFEKPLSLIGTYEIIVKVAGGAALLPGAITIQKEAIESQDDLPPILVTSTGRSGTSLMMRRLAQDKSIVVAGHFPYEIKLLTYYAHAFEVLTAPGNHQKSVDPNLIFDDPYHIGLNPFNHQDFADTFPRPKMIHEFFEKYSAPVVASAFKQTVSKFYERVSLTQSKYAARSFAEKCDVFNPTRDFTRGIYGKIREIVLVRDPRDIFCSYRAFWSTPAEQSMQILRSVRNKMMDFKRESNNDSLFVRYEDLVQVPNDVLVRISEFLDLGHVISVDQERERADFEIHATSSDSSASIGRWRKELVPSELQEFNTDFGEFFEAFGYDIAAIPTQEPKRHARTRNTKRATVRLGQYAS